MSGALDQLQGPNRPASSRTVPFNYESLAGLRVACQTTVGAAVRNDSLKLPRTWYQLRVRVRDLRATEITSAACILQSGQVSSLQRKVRCFKAVVSGCSSVKYIN